MWTSRSTSGTPCSYTHPEQWRPQCTGWVAVNAAPDVDKTDEGFRKRFTLIPLTLQFMNADVMPGLTSAWLQMRSNGMCTNIGPKPSTAQEAADGFYAEVNAKGDGVDPVKALIDTLKSCPRSEMSRRTDVNTAVAVRNHQ